MMIVSVTISPLPRTKHKSHQQSWRAPTSSQHFLRFFLFAGFKFSISFVVYNGLQLDGLVVILFQSSRCVKKINLYKEQAEFGKNCYCVYCNYNFEQPNSEKDCLHKIVICILCYQKSLFS